MEPTGSGKPDLDPLHLNVPDHTNWSRNNIAEALPGVCTALGFTFWFEPNNLGVLRGFRAVGACGRSEVKMPERPEDFFFGAFFGQAAINLGAQQPFFDRVPLYSRSTMEEVMMSRDGDGPAARGHRTAFRFPISRIARMLWTALWLSRKQAALRLETDRWWTRAVGAGKPRTIEGAVDTIVEAHDRFVHIMEIHMATGMIMGLLYARLARLAALAGHPGLETELVTGARGIDETEVLHDLWEVAHGRAGLDEFIRRYGFHGTAEGQLSEPSWREDPTCSRARSRRCGRERRNSRPATCSGRGNGRAPKHNGPCWRSYPRQNGRRRDSSSIEPGASCSCARPARPLSCASSMRRVVPPGYWGINWRMRTCWIPRRTYFT